MNDQFYRRSKPSFDFSGWLKKQLKKRNVFISLLVIIPAILFVTFGSRGILKRVSLESDKAAAQKNLEQANEDQRQLQELSKALDKDPKAIEKVAREKYGMIREGETVYKVKKASEK